MERKYRSAKIVNVLCYLADKTNKNEKAFKEEEDYQYFLESVEKTAKTFPFKLYSYCITPYEYRVLIEPIRGSYTYIVKSILTRYVRWYKRKYNHKGILFKRGTPTFFVERKNYFLQLIQEINSLPLKDGLVSDIMEWRWCSVQEILKKESKVTVETEEILSYFDNNPQKFLNFVKEGKDKEFKYEIYPKEFVIGSEEFLKEITELRKRSFEEEPPSLNKILQVVCEVTGIDIEDVRSGSQQRRPTFARALTAYIARNFTQYKSSELADFLNLTPSGVTKLMHRLLKKEKFSPTLVNKILKELNLSDKLRPWKKNI